MNFLLKLVLLLVLLIFVPGILMVFVPVGWLLAPLIVLIGVGYIAFKIIRM
jgi:hypothetical protein